MQYGQPRHFNARRRFHSTSTGTGHSERKPSDRMVGFPSVIVCSKAEAAGHAVEDRPGSGNKRRSLSQRDRTMSAAIHRTIRESRTIGQSL